MNPFVLFRYEVENCPICFEECLESLGTIACGHVFHHDCIRNWVFKEKRCPICRSPSGDSAKQLKMTVKKLEVNETQKFLSLLHCDDADNAKRIVEKNSELYTQLASIREKLEEKSKKLEEAEQNLEEKAAKLAKLESELDLNNQLKASAFKSANDNEQKRVSIEKQFDSQTDLLRKLEQEVIELRKFKAVVDNGDNMEEENLRLARNHYPLNEQADLFFQTVIMKKAEIARLNKNWRRAEIEMEELRKKVVELKKDNEKKNALLQKADEEIKSMKKQKEVKRDSSKEDVKIIETPKNNKEKPPSDTKSVSVLKPQINNEAMNLKKEEQKTFGKTLNFGVKRVNA